MGRYLRAAKFWLLIFPAAFWLGLFGIRTKRQDETDDALPNEKPIRAEVKSPEEEHDDRQRTHGTDVWLIDFAPSDRLKIAENCFNKQQQEVGMPIYTVEQWYADKKKREAANKAALART